MASWLVVRWFLGGGELVGAILPSGKMIGDLKQNGDIFSNVLKLKPVFFFFLRNRHLATLFLKRD